MSTQPVGYDDAHDPAHILNRLPEREREQFLSEYRAAVETAAHEVWRYRYLQQLLHTWSIKAEACNKPDYYTSRDEARSGAGEYTTLEDVVARRRAGAIEQRWGPFPDDALAWATQVVDRVDDETPRAS